MNFIRKFFTIFIVLIIFTSISNSDEQIVYLDFENVVNNTKAGKSILSKLEKSKNSALLELEKKEKDLKKIGDEIKKQKNVISEDEFKKRLVEFRKKINNFKKNKEKVITEFNQKKEVEFGEFFKKITPIIEKYVSEKEIDIVLSNTGKAMKSLSSDKVKLLKNKF